MTASLRVSAEILELRTRHPFIIARGGSSDYRTVSTALNSGVPLSLSNHSDLAAQFSNFTRHLLGVHGEEAKPEPERRRAFLGIL